MTRELKFKEVKPGQEYAALNEGVQVFIVKRDPDHWTAFDMAGLKVLSTEQYRHDLFERLQIHHALVHSVF